MTELKDRARRQTRGCMTGVLVAIALIGGCRLWWNHITYFETKKPLTLAQSRECGHISLPLPDTASNIWVYYKKHGPGTYDYRMRFDAPTTDCMTFAQLIITNYPKMTKGWQMHSFPPAYSGGSDSLSGRLPWYNIDMITKGVTWDYNYRDTDGGSSVHQSMYLDLENGVFYFFSGD